MYKVNDRIVIHSYKHDEHLHRIWTKARVIAHDDKKIIVANKRTRVIESNGRFWHTREPSVTWFFKDHWFNVIGILRQHGVYYYCNIASPYVLDDEALKYIDYDLDIKVFPDYTYRVLDRGEYNTHKEKMRYPKKLQDILEAELSKLKRMIENKQGPFAPDAVRDYYQTFKRLKK